MGTLITLVTIPPGEDSTMEAHPESCTWACGPRMVAVTSEAQLSWGDGEGGEVDLGSLIAFLSFQVNFLKMFPESGSSLSPPSFTSLYMPAWCHSDSGDSLKCGWEVTMMTCANSAQTAVDGHSLGIAFFRCLIFV